MPKPSSDDVSLKDYLDLRFAESEKAVNAALAAAKEAVAAALASAEKAVDKAEENTRLWQQAANEWRGAMTDRERDFMSRREFYSIIGAAVLVIGVILAAVNHG